MFFRYRITLLLVMSSKRKCHLSPDSFCYICGYYIGSKQQKRKISPGTKLVTAHSAYLQNLSLPCLSAIKTKHGLLIFAIEVVGQRGKDG